MENLSNIGRIFYGISMAVIGFLTVYRGDFPYMLLPPKHDWIPGLSIIASVFGAFLMVAGAGIVFEKKAGLVSLLLGGVLLSIFCFCFIPYQLFVSKNNLVFGDWENAAKELTLASGAFVVAGCFVEKDENTLIKLLSKLIPFGSILFSITIMSYGMDHFLYANEAADYVPGWLPYPVFWIYFTGLALFSSGLAIVLKIKVELIATLLGAMIFTWFVILHVPRVIVSPPAYLRSEIANSFLALAYSGIAFVVTGAPKKQTD